MGYKLIRRMDLKGKYMQTAFLNLDNKIIVDFYYYYQEDDDVLVNHNDVGKLVLPLKFVTSFDSARGFKVPKPCEDYLVFRYGNGWRTPTNGKRGWSEDAGEALVR